MIPELFCTIGLSMNLSILRSVLFVVGVAIALPVFSESLPTRQIEMQVKIQNQIEVFNLEKLNTSKYKKHIFKTKSSYEKGEIKCEGILLEDLIQFNKIKVKYVEVMAADNYIQKIPGDVIAKYNPYVVFKINDQFLTPKNRGTFRIIFDNSKISRSNQVLIDPLWV